MIEDGCTDDYGVLLPNVTGKILTKVLENYNKHDPSGAEAATGIGSSSAAVQVRKSSRSSTRRSWMSTVPGHAVRAHPGRRQLPRREGAARHHLQEGCRLDEGQVAGGNQGGSTSKNDFMPEEAETHRENARAFE
ncbi:unnamed protein product [Urochloa humidicola]